MALKYKYELKTWGVYFTTVFFAFFFHELGHCIVAWAHGVGAVPTPAKEYLLGDVAPRVGQYIELGGVCGTALIAAAGIIFFMRTRLIYKSALLAGTIATPGVYVLMFLLKGRGHDGTEFQEAQAALGLSYAGHSLDWFFLTLFLCAAAVWVIRAKPSLKVIPRILLGMLLTLVFAVELQRINNAIFDPILSPKQTALTPKSKKYVALQTNGGRYQQVI